MGCLKCIGLFTLLVAASVPLYCYWKGTCDLPPLKVEDELWGDGKQQKNQGKARDFKISVKDSEIADLKRRIESARLKAPLKGVAFEYGFNTNYLKTVLEHWSKKYNWKAEEKRLNSFPQYLMNVDGLDVHYVHVKPNAKGKKVIPIMLVHGWPGSFVEFYESIPLLTKPRPNEDFVFEVICPSIPGYGFSEAPSKPGFNQAQAAKLFVKLMVNLGHEKFYLQGGDWGSVITTIMAQLEPKRVMGLHLNMVSPAPDPLKLARWILGSYIPQLGLSEEYAATMYPASSLILRLLRESGYAHIQGTKPDTVGVGLSDSPAGLAAYILEKFSSWTDMDSIVKDNGGLTEKFTLDHLLTNVMVYWISNSITSSQRFYKELFTSKFQDLKIPERPVLVPTALLKCRKELFQGQAIGKDIFKSVIASEWGDCGHFAAMENPKLLTDSVWSFAKALQKLQETKKNKRTDL